MSKLAKIDIHIYTHICKKEANLIEKGFNGNKIKRKTKTKYQKQITTSMGFGCSVYLK